MSPLRFSSLHGSERRRRWERAPNVNATWLGQVVVVVLVVGSRGQS